MENALLRNELYSFAANNLRNVNLRFKDIGEVIYALRESAIFLAEIEKITGTERQYFDFIEIYRSISKNTNQELMFYVSSAYQKRLEMNEKKREKDKDSFDEMFSAILSAVIKYQNKVIDRNYLFEENKREQFTTDNSEIVRTFLSYAYDDKGLSLSLFVYFLLNGGFLYVDWMWNSKADNCAVLKNKLDEELDNSNQLLFLRTAASELKIRGNHTVRQWCSWEIGNYYTKNKHNKYVLAFYDDANDNFFLKSFKVMTRVVNGVIS